MDINCSRYFDSIGVSRYNKDTFLNHWERKWKDWFFEHYRKEANISQALTFAYHEKETAKGRHGMDVVADDEYKRIEESSNPIKVHKFIWWIVNIPFRIKCWLCCGWKLKYVPSDGICKGYWTYIDRYHMMSKLCRYGSPMWSEYKFTWWDKLRFKWITGYKYENVFRSLKGE